MLAICAYTMRSLLLAIVALALIPQRVSAQLAPTGGHYAARPSDTGHGVGPNGAYSASVPLDLIPASTDLPIPFAIVHGGSGFGAAGWGWDVPLSYVYVDATFNHRRPDDTPNATPQPRERVSVSLLGQRIDFVRGTSAYTWIARRDATTLTLQQFGSTQTVWKLYDGEGRTYEFEQDTKLANTGLWLLQRIKRLNNSVAVTYVINEMTLPGGGGKAIAIDVNGVEYDRHPTSSCYKHVIGLEYDWPSTFVPLSLSIVGEHTFTRFRKLLRVNVQSRAACNDAPTTIRSYALSYAEDPDTRQLRLSSVRVTGRAGFPGESTSLPVASYTYGTATSNGTLRYQRTQSIPMPQVWNPNIIADSARAPGITTPYSDATVNYITRQNLTDVTGDGRPDLVYTLNNELWVARNLPGVNGDTTFGLVNTKLTDATLGTGPIETMSLNEPRFGALTNATYTWRQSIDVNGDGRMDIIDASEEPDHWAIYLNTPDPGLSGVKWVRRAFKITALYEELTNRGHDLRGGYLPLGKRRTGPARENRRTCWMYTNSVWVPRPTPECSADGTPTYSPEQLTFVEWEVRDLNGDGYPDVVFNSTPVTWVLDENMSTRREETAPPYGAVEGLPYPGLDTRVFGPAFDNKIEAVMNVGGVLMFDNVSVVARDPFSAPIDIATSWCGVGQWSAFDSADLSSQTLTCGLAEVNGDGLVDRVQSTTATGTRAYFGTGAGFAASYIQLPYQLATHRTTHDTDCTSQATGSTDEQRLGLRDLTGDGIPDYIEFHPFEGEHGRWYVRIGNGVGFAPEIPIDPGFVLSTVRDLCDGSKSETLNGLYDIDGDGKPETIDVSHGRLEVFQLAGGSTVRTPEAGRLVGIDNGHGAVTSIRYRSAKEDSRTLHQVPFPEIVVSSIETGGGQLGGSLTATHFAYGGAEMFYDPVVDAFRMAGYRRTIELVHEPRDVAARAKLADTYGLQTFDAAMTSSQRFGRYLRVGRSSDTTMLAGALGDDPWALLGVDIATDARRIASSHVTYDARVLVQHDGDDFCWDVMYPYDADKSMTTDAGGGYGICWASGFMYGQHTSGWRGSAGPPSDEHVATSTFVRSVDDYGRPTSVLNEGDTWLAEDDYCVDTDYADPAGNQERVLSAPMRRIVWDCARTGTAIYSVETFLYDQLPVEQVSRGLVTSHDVTSYDLTTGASLGLVRQFDAAYDANGNLIQVQRQRDANTETTQIEYDPFGLVATKVTSLATGTPPLVSSVVVDPVTLDVVTSTDPSGIESGTQVDTFGRTLIATTRAPGKPVGAVAQFTYLGFEGNDPLGQRVMVKELTDPVAPVPATIAAAPGRTQTAFFDELGRARYTSVPLGADYAGQTLIAGARTYDGLGRVVFEADPYPASESASTAYGTSSYFGADGTPSCAIRGRGRQDYTTITDEANERFPTCYTHTFANHRESIAVQSADSLLATSAQAGVIKQVTASALGRPFAQTTWRNNVRLEHAELAHDVMGNRTRFIRYQNPVTASSPVEWKWSYDSLGQVRTLDEPAVALQTRHYNNAGDLVETRWNALGVEPTKSVFYKYDARGRLVHRHEETDRQLDRDSVADYFYDLPQTPTALVSPTFVLGRLARASTPANDVYLSYDVFGNVDARSFTSVGDLVVEKQTFHANDSLAKVELFLPDTSWKSERVDYEYDSADQPRKMTYVRDGSSQLLFSATSIDAFGRLRGAKLGASTFTASYADVGRRLFQNVEVRSPSGYRRIEANGYDPVGRERARAEKGFTRDSATTSEYDALGRILVSLKTDGAATLGKWSFGYDPIGNITTLDDKVGTRDAAMSFLTTDRDRLCRIGYGGQLGGTTCNVEHDSLGNITKEPQRTGFNQLTYFNSGAVRSIENATGAHAAFEYDALGGLQRLDITSPTEIRSDRHFGDLVTSRVHANGAQTTSYFSRTFPGPGLTVSRRGTNGPWNFTFGESRGNRFSVDLAGTFVQSFDYQPYGETTSSGAAPGTPQFTTEQWNDGDALAPFGLVHLGARLYDPVIGRFLSRDPLVLPRTAATTNPYAFAMNDPQNRSDPTGLDPCAGDPMCVSSGISVGGGGGGGEVTIAGAVAIGALVAGFDLIFGGDRKANGDGAANAAHNIAYYTALGNMRIASTYGGSSFSISGFVSGAARAYAGVVYAPLGAWDALSGELAGVHTVTDLARKIAIFTSPLASGWEFTSGVYDDFANKRYFQGGMKVVTTAASIYAATRSIRVPNAGAVRCRGAGCGVVVAGEEGCFTAGTSVSTPTGFVAIETVEPGDRVRSLDAKACTEPVEPNNCQQIDLVSTDATGRPIKASVLRTTSWVDENAIRTGAEVMLDFDELAIHGHARVTSVRACALAKGPGCLVTGTVTRRNDSVLRLRFVGTTQTVEPTATHRFWSVDRNEWVAAVQLSVGERLMTKGGEARIFSIERLVGDHQVFNFEVAGSHTYVVSELELKTHNGCAIVMHPELEVAVDEVLSAQGWRSRFAQERLLDDIRALSTGSARSSRFGARLGEMRDAIGTGVGAHTYRGKFAVWKYTHDATRGVVNVSSMDTDFGAARKLRR